MINKRMLKFALGGFLLAGITTAIAATGDPAVTLQNGVTATWDDFVGVINGTIKVTGTPKEDVPSDDALWTDLANANTKLDEARNNQTSANDAIKEGSELDQAVKTANANVTAQQGVVNDKKDAVTTAEGVVTEKQKAVEKAKAAVSKEFAPLQTAINTDSTNYYTSVALVTTKQNQISSLEKDQSSYNSQLQAANTKLQSLNTSLTQINDSINSLTYSEKKDEIKTIVPWLEKNLTIAKSFSTKFKLGKPAETDTTVIYVNKEFIDAEVLCVAYQQPSADLGYTKTTIQEFATFAKTIQNPTKVNMVCVYLGKDSATGKDYYDGTTLDGCLDVDVTNATGTSFPSKIATAITNLSNTSGYSSTITKTERVYDDPQLKAQLDQRKIDVNASIRATNQTVAEVTAKLNGGTITKTDANGNPLVGEDGKPQTETFTGVNNQINTLQGEIDKLNTETNPALKAAWETSRKAYNYAITATEKLAVPAEGALVEGFNATQVDLINKVVEKKDDVTTAESAVTTAQADVTAAEGEVATANEELERLQGLAAEALANFNDAKAAAEKAAEDVTAAETEVSSVNAKLQALANANAKAVYDEVTVAGVIDVTTTINSFNGVIYGDKENLPIFNVPTGSYLFKSFGGQLNDAAVNGNTFQGKPQGVTPEFTRVARWNGSQGAYYNENSVATNYSDFGQFGYAIRDEFGVNFSAVAADNKIVALTPATKVYNITVNNQNGTNLQYYVTIDGQKNMTNSKGAAVTLPVNTFAQSATDDIADFELANVYYGTNNDCALVKITDGQTFYCPADINAISLDYNRTFKPGFNSVCLPFEINYKDFNYGDELLALCTFDKELDAEFHFTKATEKIEANTPLLVNVSANSQGWKFPESLTNVTIKKTEKQLNRLTSNNGGESFGMLRRSNPAEILGDIQKERVFGLQNNSFVQASSSATFPAFRMVIASDLVFKQSEAQRRAPRKIRIFDEDGIEITDIVTGVQGVAAEELAFDVQGGQGEIIFTSDNNYGEVAVYDMDGRMVKMVNVYEGTTVADVQKGLYIVMGKKVMVK